MSLRYSVIGSGAIGGFYGAMLARSGQQVDFLFHSDYEFVRENGLQVDSIFGNFHLSSVSAYKSTKDMPVSDVVLVGLKTTSNYLLKEMLPSLLHPNTVVILIQNGLGMEEDLSVDFPQLNIAGGMAFIASSKQGAGKVLHQDYGRLTLASYNVKDERLLQEVCNDFVKAGVDVVIASDLTSARWQKLQWNIPFNGLSVVLNSTTDYIVNHPDASLLAADLMREVVLASKACNVCSPILDEAVADMMETTRKMTPYAPSMKLDYDFGREMEIHYIYTRPMEIARQHGFEMKKTEMLGQLLKFIQKNKL